ncbi:MAG: AmmeMemoRadiSam system protein B [candidate division WOR-3 bacterium]
MIRTPVVSGQFYPADSKTLTKTIDDLLNQVKVPAISGHIYGIVVPHAGYPYSGFTAAHAYKIIANQDIQTVILLGPTHQVFLNDFAIYGEGTWQTPLGEVEIDTNLANVLIKSYSKIKNLPQAHNQEHSLEVQIPFLQRTLKNIKIVPIMMLEPSYDECQKLAKTIAHVCQDKKVLVLASSDLYHGYSYTDCQKTDALTLSYLTKYDPAGLYKALQTNKAQACGGYPIVVAMLTAQHLGADKSRILYQTNSNDVIGERGGYCVGYASAIFFKETNQSNNKQEDAIEFTKQEQQELINIARKTLESYINNKIKPIFKPSTERLKEEYGVFVTLKKHGELRGCIGYVQGIKPLYEAVADMTIAAATEDPRFPSVQKFELKDIDIEITVMTPLKKIASIDEIIVGKHGLLIKRGNRSGLLLPQVATEEGWDKITFLQHTCWKAGLPENAWQDKNTEIYIFSGTIIHEKK